MNGVQQYGGWVVKRGTFPPSEFSASGVVLFQSSFKCCQILRRGLCYQQQLEWTGIADILERFHLKANEPECLVRPNWNCRGTNSSRMHASRQHLHSSAHHNSHSYPMLSCSKLIGFITTGLVMGGAPVPFSFITYADDNGGGAQTTFNHIVTVRSIKAVPVPLSAYFYSSDCPGDLGGVPSHITYDQAINTGNNAHGIKFVKDHPIDDLLPVPFSFIAYAEDNNEGEQTFYDDAVTDVCYPSSATVRSVYPSPEGLSASFYRSGDCSHVDGDNRIEGFRTITYDKVTNTGQDTGSIIFERNYRIEI
ncbi:hypothetical protein FB451DRAFT_1167902 [Mycena latifolia]|nr:hypothetical protein FB451DRAFT_1167902 [Mycena latifolia]